jgi:hypothetical protein
MRASRGRISLDGYVNGGAISGADLALDDAPFGESMKSNDRIDVGAGVFQSRP